MAVFNSLGSNYSWGFVGRSLLARGSAKKNQQVASLLAAHYGGTTTLTYKGRLALELALRQTHLPRGSRIGVSGFTCYVVYQAVKRAGYTPVFLDVTPGQMHFGLAELKQAADLAAIIVQNTLGYPADMPGIQTYCKAKSIIIIEDLAHSLGASYADGQEAGQVGAFTMLSFSQDKPLDVVAGGAVVNRHSDAVATTLPKMSIWQQHINRVYPFWSRIIRATYPIGLGRYIHFALKKARLMATPMSDNLQGLHGMDGRSASLLLRRWRDRQKELAHRRQIARIYAEGLPKTIQIRPLDKTKPSYLRFAIVVEQRDSLIRTLKKHQVHVGDTWYDAPIGPKRYLAQTSYKPGDCPNAESLAAHIVNLPTHQNVSPKAARNICATIKQWLLSQQKA